MRDHRGMNRKQKCGPAQTRKQLKSDGRGHQTIHKETVKPKDFSKHEPHQMIKRTTVIMILSSHSELYPPMLQSDDYMRVLGVIWYLLHT